MIRFFPGLTMLPDHRLKLEAMALLARAQGAPIEIYWTFESISDKIEDHARKAAMLLMREVEKKPGFQCHIWCHSMGGLVARYMLNHVTISKPWKEVVKSVTTFASPHRGTPIANSSAAQKIWGASYEMSDAGAALWNNPACASTYSPEPEGIPFYSWCTYLKSQWSAEDLAGFFGYRSLARSLKEQGRVPDNDSVVPLDSQRFGTYLGDTNVQHQFFSLPTRDVARFYAKHWNWLRARHP